MVGALLIAALLAPPASGPWELNCLMTAGARSSNEHPPAPVTLQMELRGRRVVSVTVDGPPIISSFVGVASFGGSQDSNGAITITESRPQSRQLRWRGNMEGGTLRLRRRDSEILLSPDAASSGAYVGSWRVHDIMEGHIVLVGDGDLSCAAAGAQNNGTTS